MEIWDRTDGGVLNFSDSKFMVGFDNDRHFFFFNGEKKNFESFRHQAL